MTAPSGSLWRDRRFGAFWFGFTVSQFGDRITELALPLIAVVTLGATANEVGLLTAAVWLPSLLALFVGAWVDHQTGKKRLLVAADLIRAAVLLSLPIGYLLDAITLWQLFAVALLTGCGQVLFGTAYPTFFVTLVEPARYVDANSKLSTSRAVSFVTGPAVAGGLIQLLTAPVAVLVDVISFVVSAVAVGRIRVREPERSGADEPSLARRAAEGLRVIAGHPVLRASLGATTTVNFFTFMAQALLILFAARTLDLSAAMIGSALGVGAVGGVVGAVLAPALARWIGVGRTVVLGGVLFPAAILLVAVADGPLWLRVGLFGGAELLSSMGVMFFDVNLNALLAHVTPDAVRARTNGAYTAVNYGIRPLGAVVGGWFGTVLGLRPTLAMAAVGGAMCVLWLLPSPILKIRELVPEEATAVTAAADQPPRGTPTPPVGDAANGDAAAVPPLGGAPAGEESAVTPR